MRKAIFSCAAVLMALCLCGCNLEEEERRASLHTTAAATSAQTSQSAPSAQQTTTQNTSASTSIAADDVIPDAVQTPRVDGDRLSYSIMNVYADGDYYTVDISGVKYESYEDNTSDIDTTYIGEELYGDFRLDLMKKGEIIDTLKINVPRNDRFLILESVTQNLSYGCELLSNMREFSAEEYPDLIQLDFYMPNEVEAPQYARYFAVSDGKIIEVPVYENGEEVAPYGTHLEMESAGEMVQHLVAGEYDGSYTIIKYEYSFDTENMCLNRKKVKFYGWED
jgi:hypothetical protein